MSKLVFDPYRIGPWVCNQIEASFYPGRSAAIGLENDEGELIAGVLYDDYNKAQVICHIHGTGNWAVHRKFLWTIHDYPFNQLKVKRVTTIIAEKNEASRKLVEGLGFELEFIAQDAHPDGGLCVYKLTRDKCKWLKKEANNEPQ